MVDRIGLPEEGVDVEMRMRYHASIKADWPEEQREAAFDQLETMGGGSLVRVVLEVQFDKGDLELAYAAAEHLRRWNEFGNRPISLRKGVQWQTLTSFVREMHERQVPIPTPERIGATITREARVVKRKKGKTT
jgi:hypothetical protein